ncbi:hypothetical protein FHR81_001968 [Actinoalloteichus hoggarensis]|uniref:Uncharacterized protein n=1 Tax=Actinoalloteichus hoggarensis TaxID=1470176 RepID=A0A221W5X2_9PSEU|nr:hypothetical protein [Actinoalloteichus hoggarensis]ASO20999.1 hypothetical protein AHOG_16865 [Actinoalloteichus hoggarensis]MBB5920930.1 hypothetical protein [Actinoalloteichus hoggarensis]
MSLIDEDIPTSTDDGSRRRAAEGTRPPRRRWAGVFRRLEHRRDPTYRQVDVGVCGAICEPVEDGGALPRCPVCHPGLADHVAGMTEPPATN